MLNTTRLRVAFQRNGRLSADSFELLKRCAIKIRQGSDCLFVHSENFPLDVLMMRDDDIPGLVMDGVCDYGIVGTNVLEEAALQRASAGKSCDYQIEQALNFGVCRLALAVPQAQPYHSPKDLKGLRIATSYPNLLQRFLKQHAVDAQIVMLSGSVEIAPRLGLADVICDLVSTGATLEANQLRAVENVFISQAVLIRNRAGLCAEKAQAAELLMRRIEGVQKASESKYIMMHAPKVALPDIVKLIPGAENPTLLPLADEQDKVALHAVCQETLFWETMEKLKALGASSILVLPIEKMMA